MAQPVRASLRPLVGMFSPRVLKKSASLLKPIRRCSSSSRVLGQTSLLLQDGLEIHELPLVIRRMSASEYPFTSAIYAGEGHIQTTAQEELFKQSLQGCSNLHQVFSLLEIPGDHVTPYSAAFALHRLDQLHEGSSDTPDSFIRRAIFHELCDTATRDVQKLTTETVIGLVKCYLNSRTFNEDHKICINEELEKRIGDGSLDVTDVCSLIRLLSEGADGNSELVSNLWTHLAARYQDVNHENIARVYSVLRNLCPRHRYILNVLDRRMVDCWWKLPVDDVAVIMRALCLVNYKSFPILNVVGKWLFMNIHDVQDHHLRDIVGTYIHFEFTDANVMKALERYVGAKNECLNKTVGAIIMEYCRMCRCLSPKIYDVVAVNFEKNYSKYDIDEIFFMLRPFGQLNYVPPTAGKLFTAVEDMLSSRFTEFPPHRMLELLASFVYIKRIPTNFITKVFNPHFLARLNGLEPLQRGAVSQYLRQLQIAAKLDVPGFELPPGSPEVYGHVSNYMFGRWFRFHQELGECLKNTVDMSGVKVAEIVKNTPYFVDYLIPSSAIPHLRSNRRINHKLALLTVMPEHTCVNTQHALGPYAMRKRHLQLLGYTTLEVYYDDLMWKHQTSTERQAYVLELLGRVKGKS